MMRYVEIDRASKQTARAYHEQASVSQYEVQHYTLIGMLVEYLN